MTETLTMMAGHPHPGREARRTGAVLASYSARSISTELLARADRAAGDPPGGIEPSRNAHDERAGGPGP